MKDQSISTGSPWASAPQSNIAARSILILLLLFVWPGMTKAQFNYTIDNGTVTITEYIGQDRTLTIPSTITGLPVASIGDFAFSYGGFTSVFIPHSVTSIGKFAFEYCFDLTSLFIPNNVTSIGDGAFSYCFNLLNVTLGDSDTNNPATSVGDAFLYCRSLTNVTIGNGVTRISGGFVYCDNLVNVTIGTGVTNIDRGAFDFCPRLTSIYFEGNAPGTVEAFIFDPGAVAYYQPGTSGWGAMLNGIPTKLLAPPTIIKQPSTQTTEFGSSVNFWVQATNLQAAATYQWFFNRSIALSGATNWYLGLTNVQMSQVGDYTLVIRNPYANLAVTSSPAALNVISPVQRRIVPSVVVSGASGSLMHLEYTDSLDSAAPHWFSLSDVTPTDGSQLCFDLSEQLPAQRFYRAWQTSGVRPALDISAATEIPLTGAIGNPIRIDYINQFGPTNAWVTLGTVTLTNTTQFYFDVSMFRQPNRLYRLLTSP